LNGYVTTYGLVTNVTFCYGTTSAVTVATGALTTCTSTNANVAQVSSNSSDSVTVSSLTANTTYYFQIVATNVANTNLKTYGAVQTFITSAAPAVSTVAADSVTATTGNLKGTITANGASTVGSFCLATDSTIDPDSGVLQNCIANPTSVATVAGNGSGVAFNYYFTNLVTSTTYYFQATAENSRGTVSGSVLSFSTSTLPVAITSAATSVGSTTATLNGSAAANTGTNTTVQFCYAASASNGADLVTASNGRITAPTPTCPTAKTTTLTGNTVSAYTESLSGLTGGTLYFFQIQVTNPSNSAYGAVYTFTPGISTVTTDTVTAITATSATVSGTATRLPSSGGSADTNVSAYMCISSSNTVDVNGMLSCNVDQQASATSVTGSSGVAVSYSTSALSAGRTYYYQAILNSDKTAAAGAPAVGSVLSFTTNPQVTFNGNGATSGSTSAKNATFGSTSTLTGNGFSRTRYTFAGWGTSAETTTVAYTNGANFVFNSNTTLYAIWTFNGFIVSFNANGGSGAAMADQQSNSAANLTANTYTLTGFNFDGWATTPTGAQVYANSASYPFTADVVLYARWVSTGKQIRFIGNGATGGFMAMQSVPSGVGTALRGNAFTRTGGYTFAGWTETSTSTTVEFADSATVTTTVDMTLYAIWTTLNKVVTFDANAADATGTMSSQTASTSGNLTANAFTRDKYTFMGWAETATATTVQYANSANFAFDRDIYLYALWAGRVSYNGNGADSGSSGPTDATYYYDGQSAPIASPSGFTKTGLTLIGWAQTPAIDATTPVVTSGNITMAGNITLYAVWAARVTYVAPDKTSGSIPVDTNDYLPGTDITLAIGSGITRTDWTFEGWSAGTGTDTLHPATDTFKLNVNTTLSAVWSTTLFSYAITLDDNGDPANQTVQNGYTSTNIRLIANPFTKTGYTFGGWSTLDTATVSEYSDRGLVTVPNDGYAITLYAIWTLTPTPPAPPTPPSGGGGGGGSAPAPTPSPTPSASPSATPKPTATSSASATPKPAPSPTLKPVITGTLTTVVTAKTIKPNAIVTLTQVVKVAVPTSVSVQSITVNGIATQVQSSAPAPTPSKSPSAGSTPAPSTTKAPTTSQVVSATTTTVVGPDDKVKVNATTDSGQKIQGVVEIEKVDPFTLANVNFDFASAKLTPAAKKILDQVAAVVIDHGFNVIQLTGHTDVLASPGYSNQVLSDQRAAAVRAYLAKKLVGEGVVVQSLGLAAKEPVIAKTDEASRALNRRVEILVATK
jgi:uncharacterized repeat protein (TIGR02543 family)